MNLLEKIRSFLSQYVHFSDPGHELIAALYSINSATYEVFDSCAIMVIESAEPASGKTTLLKCLDSIIPNSQGIAESLTPAVLGRSSKGKTLIYDEIDSSLKLADLRSLLNASSEKGLHFVRCDMKKSHSKESYEPTQHVVFGPKILCGISGDKLLHETTKSRCFVIRMERQNSTERHSHKRLRGKKYQMEAAAIKAEIQAWAESEKDRLAVFGESLAETNLPYLDGFSDRTIDIAEPLAAILNILYSGNPREAEIYAEFSRAISVVTNETSNLSQHIPILRAVMGMMDSTGESTITEQPSALARMLGEQPLSGVCEKDELQARLTKALRAHGFETKSVRMNGSPRPCYVLDRAELERVIQRYMPNVVARSCSAENDQLRICDENKRLM